MKVYSPVGSNIAFVRAPDPETSPGPPQTPTVSHSNGTAALLHWSLPKRQGASPVISYTIEYYSSGGGAWQTAAKGVRVATYLLTRLDPGQSYGVTVRARNSHGMSEPSGIAEVGGTGSVDMGISALVTNKLQKAKVILQEANPVATSSAKILWQVSLFFNFKIIKLFM